MNPKIAAMKAPSDLSAGTEATVLRLHGEKASAIDAPGIEAPALEAPRPGSLILDDPRALGAWNRALDDFVDRRAIHRLVHYAACHAGHRWKPNLALVLPAGFSMDRTAHLRDLAAALEVLAAVVDHYHIDVVSDSPDAARLFRRVIPFSREAISATAGALVLLSRSLNDEVGAIRPSRLVAADPCAYRADKKRIAFAAAGLALASRPAEDLEILRNARGCASVLLDEDEAVHSFLEAMRRLRASGLPFRLTLSSRADEDFARRIRAAFHHDPRVEVREPEPGASHDVPEYQISNDPITLMTQRESGLPRYLFHRGRFWSAGGERPRRSDVYLLRGEESNAHGLLETWLGRRKSDRDHPASPSLGGALEPMVSMIVPVFDLTTEVLRLARTIYEQDYHWIEVVFVCNGSPPETMEAVRAAENYLMKRRYVVRIIELADGRGSTAMPRDIGVRASRGDLVCLLDSGDWLEHGFLTFLRIGPWRGDTLYYPRRILHDPGRGTEGGVPDDRPIARQGPLESADLVSALRRDDFLGTSGVVFARALFDRVGGIDHRFHDGEAFHLWWRMARAGARAEDHCGRINLSIRPEDLGPSFGEDGRAERAFEPARGRERIQCP